MKALLSLGLLCSACSPLYRSAVEIGFEQAETLQGRSGTWQVVELPDAPSPTHALMQSAASGADAFNLALREGAPLAEADVHLKLRAVDGALEQGGGFVWRARDERNYYVARWNPLQKNLCAYKIVDGVRTQLASAKVDAGAGWHTLRVWFVRDKFEVWFDKQSLLQFKDPTFYGPGQIGVWTQADARTQFDDLELWEFRS
jgi:hypothetical protein